MVVSVKRLVVVFILSIISFSAYAENKVVVIPMGADSGQLECTTNAPTSISIAPGTYSNIHSNSCDAGWVMTGGGCRTGNHEMFITYSRTVTNTYFCEARNTGSSADELYSYARCCRVQ